MDSIEIGEIVVAKYKTGKYIGEVTALRPQHAVVRVLSVLAHPTQGDLHNPKQVSEVFFHQRRALAEREQANIPLSAVKKHEGDVLPYQESLRLAITEKKAKCIQMDNPFSKKSLQLLEDLEKDYFK